MRYFGGKSKLGKILTNVIISYLHEKGINTKETIYIEPFCGALGLMKYIVDYFEKCYANDLCKDLIMLHKQVKSGTFKNPKITKEKWMEYKFTNKSSAERAFAGFGCSFGGSFFNGYINDSTNNDMTYSSIIKMKSKIQKITFSNKDYYDFLKCFKFESNKKYVIYFDPPYKNTSCQPWPEFDSNKFWTIVKKLGSYKNITVIVSEKSAPPEFKSIFKINRRNGMHNITTDKVEIQEYLFVLK